MKIFQLSFFTLCLLLLNFSLFSQSNNYKKDNFIIDSLTKRFTTYSVKLITKDTSAHFRNGDQSELISTFKFLKRKKLVQKNPDVTFNVFIDNIILQYPSSIIEQQSSSNPNVRYPHGRHEVVANYVLSIALQVVSKEGSEYKVTLLTNEDHQKKYYVAIPSPNDNRIGFTRPDVGSFIQKYADKFTINIPLFITDFNVALRDYRRR